MRKSSNPNKPPLVISPATEKRIRRDMLALLYGGEQWLSTMHIYRNVRGKNEALTRILNQLAEEGFIFKRELGGILGKQFRGNKEAIKALYAAELAAEQSPPLEQQPGKGGLSPQAKADFERFAASFPPKRK